VQQTLPFKQGWGGHRVGAGRTKSPSSKGVHHRARPEHKARHPVHVTLRLGRRLPSLRQQVIFSKVREAFRRSSREWFRLVHFSVQRDHVHLLVEAHDKNSLARGMAGIAICIARRVNALLNRRGRFWAERYHARPLRTPREVRHAIVYIVMNWRKHSRPRAFVRPFDPYSSASWLDGWALPGKAGRSDWNHHGPSERKTCPVRPPLTWLASTGWKRWGLLGIDERPKETAPV